MVSCKLCSTVCIRSVVCFVVLCVLYCIMCFAFFYVMLCMLELEMVEDDKKKIQNCGKYFENE